MDDLYCLFINHRMTYTTCLPMNFLYSLFTYRFPILCVYIWITYTAYTEFLEAVHCTGLMHHAGELLLSGNYTMTEYKMRTIQSKEGMEKSFKLFHFYGVFIINEIKCAKRTPTHFRSP